MSKGRAGRFWVWASLISTVLCLSSLACLGLMFGSILVSFFESGDDDEKTYAQVGQPAPDFLLNNIAGQPVRLSDFKGHPVLLNFWTTWCGPCKEEMPIIQDRYNRWAPRLVVVGVDECESNVDVISYIQTTIITFPIVLDEDCKVGEHDYLVHAYPTSFFIDAQGIIRAVMIGSMTADYLDSTLLLIGVGY